MFHNYRRNSLYKFGRNHKPDVSDNYRNFGSNYIKPGDENRLEEISSPNEINNFGRTSVKPGDENRREETSSPRNFGRTSVKPGDENRREETSSPRRTDDEIIKITENLLSTFTNTSIGTTSELCLIMKDREFNHCYTIFKEIRYKLQDIFDDVYNLLPLSINLKGKIQDLNENLVKWHGNSVYRFNEALEEQKKKLNLTGKFTTAKHPQITIPNIVTTYADQEKDTKSSSFQNNKVLRTNVSQVETLTYQKLKLFKEQYNNAKAQVGEHNINRNVFETLLVSVVDKLS